ncbi:MAG: glycosyltransferase family A protein [Neisseria sp.]|nr:glycosyltransferase family A protein [Neisseria sp.]
MSPKIDVIIPCYNAAETLERAVISALRQPETGAVWLVDDTSGDNTAALIGRLKKADSRIRAETMLQNGGAAKARNWGALQSRADLIAFLDADDEYEDGALAVPQFVLQNRPDIALVRQKLQPVGLPKHYCRAEGFADAWQSLQMTVGGNMVFRRSVFLAAGGFPQDELFRRFGGEDVALGRAFLQCSIVATVFGDNVPAVRHTLHPNAHAWQLLDSMLFGKMPEGIGEAERQQADSISATIAERLRSVAPVLNTAQTGVCPMEVTWR